MSWFNLKTAMIVFAALAVLVVVVLIVLGKYPNLLKTKSGFKDLGAPSTPTFTMFYADWCGHCKKAKPDFQQFMADGTIMIGQKTVIVEMVNADSGSPKLEAFQVKGYPTFCLQTPDGTVVEYKGKRETAGYLEFLNEQLGVKNDVAGASS
jgi:thiol-disulfide isomerase/thioredoxin